MLQLRRLLLSLLAAVPNGTATFERKKFFGLLPFLAAFPNGMERFEAPVVIFVVVIFWRMSHVLAQLLLSAIPFLRMSQVLALLLLRVTG